MAFCKKCGQELSEDTKFCPSCGESVSQENTEQAQPQQQEKNNDLMSKISSLNDTADTTSEYDPADIQQNKGISVLSYLGILFLVPYLSKKESKFAQFHAKQGFNLFLVDIAYTIIYILLHLIKFTRKQYFMGYAVYEEKYTPWFITLICALISLAIMILAIIGIVNAATGKAKELPLIGKFKILK